MSIQCSRLQPQSPPRYWSGTGSVPFPQAPAGAWRILDQAGFGVVGGHVGDVLDVWPNEVVQRVHVVALLLKPRLGLFGLVGRRRVLLPQPGPATGHLIAPRDHHTLQHIQVHFDVDFQADFEDVRWHDVDLTWNHTKDHNRSRKLSFHHPGHVQICILRVLAMDLLS